MDNNIFGASTNGGASAQPAATPAAQPAAQPVAQPVVQPTAPVAQPVNTAPVSGAFAPVPGEKKGKGGIIALIIAAVLLIGGGVGAAIFYFVNESTEKVVSDAMLDAFTLEDYGMDFTLTLSAPASNQTDCTDGYGATDCYYSSEPELQEITIASSTATVGYDYDASGVANVTLTDGTKFTVGAATKLIDKKLYFHIDDLDDVISLVKDEAIDYNDLTPDEKKAVDEIVKVVKDIDDEWFEIDLTEYKSTSKALDCLHQLQDDRKNKAFKDEVIKLYTENPFVTYDKDAKLAKKDGLYQVEVSIDEKAMDAFGNKLTENEIFKNLETCVEDAVEEVEDDFGSSVNFTGFSLKGGLNFDNGVKQIEEKKRTDAGLTDVKTEKELEKPKLVLGIKPFSHKLEKVSIDYDEDEDAPSIILDGTINRGVNSIAVPTSTKTLEDLKTSIESLIKTLQEVSGGYQPYDYDYDYDFDDDDYSTDFNYDEWCADIYDKGTLDYQECVDLFAD